MKKNIFNSLLYVVIALVFIFSVTNIYLINTRFKKVGEAKETAKEMLRPATLEVIKIVHSDCKDCFDIQKSLDLIKNQNVNITKENSVNFESEEGDNLIKSYKLIKIPTLIVRGEINKSDQLIKFFEKNGVIINNNTAIYTNINPPFYDVVKDEVVGRVKIINLVDSSCELCIPLIQVEKSLANVGVAISESDSYEYNSDEAMELIREMGITKIPAILISTDLDHYKDVKKQIQNLAGEPKNGYYTIHSLNPPYRYLEEDKIVGLVNLIMLTDNSCKECYDIKLNENVLKRFGIAVDKIDTYDISSEDGKEFLSMYKITKVPMILVSPDVEVYQSFVQVWQNVGTVEEDGWYVMRNPEVLGNYKDLTTNKVVKRQVAIPQQVQ